MKAVASDKPEKALVVFVAMTFVLSIILSGSKRFESITWAPLFAGILLLGYYIFIINNLKMKALMFGMAICQAGFALDLLNIGSAQIFLYIGLITYLILSGIFVVKAIKDSLKFRNFEMMVFLMGLFLLYPAAFIFFMEVQNLLLILCFGLAFVSATIIYNDNLWDRFSEGERKIVIFQLLNSVVIISGISLKNF
ncbi:hypothetical protein MYP_2218 [Sporocytophaga myxococcoides]|uniref:Uncharacterized protein n=1 Tax=Sporocytophaga myxococcoides TaxID=153721 RepID=A0A098LDH9_9BACT|nr:hypothetical protein [Sporocytophaga myxococcoides]GAL84990.1 hypothetical protein MYP_2218 [Sporocytophaga myxococcoides]